MPANRSMSLRGRSAIQATAEPQSVIYCHCDDCRRVTGSAFNVGVGVPASTFQLSGKTKGYESTNDEGPHKDPRILSRVWLAIVHALPRLGVYQGGHLRPFRRSADPPERFGPKWQSPWSKIPDGLDKFPRSSTWGSSQSSTL